MQHKRNTNGALMYSDAPSGPNVSAHVNINTRRNNVTIGAAA